MPKVSAAFFGLGVIYVLIGMVWGMQMGGSEDFTMAPAHAHLNLLGWVTMALYGTFYALTNNQSKLPWIHFAVSGVAVAIMIPTLAMYLADQTNKSLIPVLVVGEVLAFAGMLIFGWAVLKELTRKA